ncbi:hypothetical protein BN2475_40090 [Paraburkholderia ribeironis]|uniref:Uncharacterized protein n=1 Tax=Paraburkholderia ribeironis TaxID=1247936 RepID=A0A1N7RKR3_9BURK|nr:hypothetical protein [Paraburkholderia ribeironis]SIT35277.1 hypothetical protein BN2475_40090 [Paraburkholderia ribeironis]
MNINAYHLTPAQSKGLTHGLKKRPTAGALPYTTVAVREGRYVMLFLIAHVLEDESGAICPVGPDGEVPIGPYAMLGDGGEVAFVGDWSDDEDLHQAILKVAHMQKADAVRAAPVH